MRALKITGAWAIVIAVVLAMSYWSERPKYHFEEMAKRVGQELPGARLIHSIKSGASKAALAFSPRSAATNVKPTTSRMNRARGVKRSKARWECRIRRLLGDQ